MIQLPTKKNYAHLACTTCGAVYLLPWGKDYEPAWCTHGGTYAWPATHWEGEVERDPEWRERWVEGGWTELVRCEVYIEAIS